MVQLTYNDGIKWTSLAEFLDKFGKGLGIPDAIPVTGSRTAKLQCNNFDLSVKLAGLEDPEIALIQPKLEEILQGRVKEAEAKQRQTFKP